MGDPTVVTIATLVARHENPNLQFGRKAFIVLVLAPNPIFTVEAAPKPSLPVLHSAEI